MRWWSLSTKRLEMEVAYCRLGGAFLGLFLGSCRRLGLLFGKIPGWELCLLVRSGGLKLFASVRSTESDLSGTGILQTRVFSLRGRLTWLGACCPAYLTQHFADS